MTQGSRPRPAELRYDVSWEDSEQAAAEIATLTGQVAALRAENAATTAQLVEAREILTTTAAARDEAVAAARDAALPARCHGARRACRDGGCEHPQPA